jgi:hypothetical protein
MRVRVAVAALLFSAVAAAGYWKSAGWYVVNANSTDGQRQIFTGPYASKEACEAHQPANVEGVAYTCEYLDRHPA